MRAAEASARRAAAVQRLAKSEPVTVFVYTAAAALTFLFRGACHVCLAFGIVSTAGISLWWGPPLALLLATTLGRLWEWLRRDRVVKALETMADAADVTAGRTS